MQGLLAFLRRWGDVLLLGGLAVVLLGSTLYLLTPRPQATLWVEALPMRESAGEASHALVATHDVEAPPSEASAQADTPKRQRKSPSPRPHFEKKVPKVVALNRATVAELQRLPGVGPKLAQRIADYRKAHGPFETLEAIQNVAGIGPKKFEKMKPYLRLP